MKNILFCSLMLFPNIYLMSQVNPAADIEGRAFIYDAFDSTTTHIGFQTGNGSIGNNNNTFIGFQAGIFSSLHHNTLLGSKAGWSSSGWRNTIAGSGAGESNDGDDNVLIGYQAGQSNNGNSNVFIGRQAGFNATVGTHSSNVAVGEEAGYDGGTKSVFLGYQAGKNAVNTDNALYIANAEGTPLIYGEFDNHFVEVDGQFQASKTGAPSSPTYVGVLESVGSQRPSLLFSVGGNQSFSGMAMEYDSRSTMIDAQLNFRNDVNNVFFSVIEDGNVELYGDIDRPGGELDLKAGGTTGITIETNGEVGIGTVNPAEELHVIGNARISAMGGSGMVDVQANNLGTLVKVISDQRLKKNISTIGDPLAKVLKMRGVSYEWKYEENPNKTLGVIAQEVLEVVPDIVTKNGEYYGVNYSEIPALLIEAIKEQQKMIENQQDQISILKRNRDHQKSDVQTLMQKYQDLVLRVSILEAQPHQPNEQGE